MKVAIEPEKRRRDDAQTEGDEEEIKKIKTEPPVAVETVVDDDDDDEPVYRVRGVHGDDVRSRHCPYLDTINRNLLDFDFEKLCSISLSNNNVYACLVCGKYFQGRGQKSFAYTHSVESNHHVWLNLETLKVYCLPDNYEIIDSSLDDVKYLLNPTFTHEQAAVLDKNTKVARAFDGSLYLPGIVGLNNIKANDYCNVILQALNQVQALRDYFLREENYVNIRRPPGDVMVLLVRRFAELIRKLWNSRNFKAHVSPHEMLQAVVKCSKKRFQFTVQGDPVEFLSWFINAMHTSLNGNKQADSSIINRSFQGRMRVYTKKIPPVELNDRERDIALQTEEYKETVEEVPFLFLTIDLPPPPLFRDELKDNIIPQVPLFSVLSKFDGATEKECKTHKENFIKRYEIIKLPEYLIMVFKRFTNNTFYVEKNPTIVNFPIKDVDLRELLPGELQVQEAHPYTVYDLIANVVHDGEPGSGNGTYRVHILHQGTGQWYEMQDLHVVDILPQMITLSECYIQIWKVRKEDDEQLMRGFHETINKS